MTKDLNDLPKKDLLAMLGALGVKLPEKPDHNFLLDRLENEFIRNTQATLNVVGAFYITKRLGL